jgi:hypothetical protein
MKRQPLTYTEKLGRGLAQILNDADGRKAMTNIKALTEKDDGENTKQTLTFGPFSLTRTVHNKSGKSLPSAIIFDGKELDGDPGQDVVTKIDKALGPIVAAAEKVVKVEGLPPEYRPGEEAARKVFTKDTLADVVKKAKDLDVKLVIQNGDVKVTAL